MSCPHVVFFLGQPKKIGSIVSGFKKIPRLDCFEFIKNNNYLLGAHEFISFFFHEKMPSRINKFILISRRV